MEFPDIEGIGFLVVLDKIAGIRVGGIGCFFFKVHHGCEVGRVFGGISISISKISLC